MLSGADAGIKMNSTILNFIHTIERTESYMGNAVALREEVVRKIFNPGPLFLNMMNLQRVPEGLLCGFADDSGNNYINFIERNDKNG